MVKRKDKVDRIRASILVAVAAVVVAIAGLGLYYGLGGIRDGGESYTVLEDRPDGTGDVEIVAYFSYTCPHCRNLEALIDDWRDTLPADVSFERVHVAYSTDNRLLAKANLALARHGAADANRERMFRAIHDRSRRFATAKELADYVDGYGIDRETFLRTVASPRIARQVATDEQQFLSLGLLGVPAVVIDDKYVIDMSAGRKQALAVAADLARRLLAERASG